MPRPKGSKNKPKDTADMPTKTAERTETISEQATSKGEVAVFSPPRLPFDPAIEERFGVDKGQWKVLVEAIFPAAKSADAIVMALAYCKTRGLDPFKRPVHIVPIWDSARGGYIESVWPGISELRTTASRTKGYAGCDEAQFGPAITMTFSGRVKRSGNWEDAKIELEFPEWCRITVYRIVDGQKCKFVGPKVKWLETYATQGNSELPNKMWEERSEGQLEKCAEAAALRRAFPEEIGNELTAEEMTGRSVQDLAVDVTAIADRPPAGGQDTAPPRQIAAPAESTADPEQARDGTPPRRAPKADPIEGGDPISSGPPRTVAPAKDTGPSDPGPQPHRIPGEGHTFDTWADKYCDLIKTSPDVATVYGWIDANTKSFQVGDGPKQVGPLDRLAKGKPSVYARVKKVTAETMQALKDAAAKVADKAAKKAAPKPAPNDMDGPADGEMEESLGGAPIDDNPETVLKWIETTLASVTEPEDLENIWTEHCEPKILDLFPPDKEEALGIYRKHEKRLEP